MWLGFLAASRRLSSAAAAADPELRDLIDVVPSGVSDEPPRSGVDLRAKVRPDARIAVWYGGVWDWLDPLTALRATRILRERDDRWVLAFTSMVRPSHREQMGMTADVLRLASELGLDEDGGVYFRDGWTPYADRSVPLLEADVGLSLHQVTLEARYAFRTRILDYVWTRLPIVASDGEEWADTIRARGLGAVVPPGDAEAVAAAMESCADAGRESFAAALAETAEDLAWPRVTAPLVRLIDRHARQRPPRRLGATTAALAGRHTAAALLERASKRAQALVRNGRRPAS
jgi:glycosyltransferase involved in cell wall biosynthesis